ncbi:RHS repeat-associated core domain-containing protein [Candidatus Nomurabacteria bacterium]|nr:RHS repeat-associated core domain-containing protein [Candidatus Nomurabacteria bacterium]
MKSLQIYLLTFLFILTPFAPVSAQETIPIPGDTQNLFRNPDIPVSGENIFSQGNVTKSTTITTTYPSKYYNIDSNGKVTKHIFANGVEIATIEGTGDEAKVKYIHTDNLGSTNVVTDETGAVVETLDYLPFGGVRVDKKENAFSEQRKYIGQEYDADTKLNYLNARYYDGSVGRFLSQDPVFLNPESQGKEIFTKFLTDPQSQNSYSYAGNNPITLSDPDGRSWLTGAQGFSTYLVASALITVAILSAPVTIPVAAITTVATIGLGAVGYGTYSNYQAYTNGQISKDQFDYNAGALLGGTIPLGGLNNLMKSPIIPNEALVVRGGSSVTPEAFRIDTHPSGLKGFSVESGTGLDLCVLCKNIPNNQVRITTAGDIRAVGGDIVPTSGRSSNHATTINLSPQNANNVFSAPIKNPVPKQLRTK